MFEGIRNLTDVPKGCFFNPFSDFTNLYFNVGDYTERNPNYALICKAIVEYWNYKKLLMQCVDTATISLRSCNYNTIHLFKIERITTCVYLHAYDYIR